MSKNLTVAVVGAGIVGASCALWVQKKGFSVILVDPEKPGSGTSSGNACTIADYGCVPVNSPTLFKRLPSFSLTPTPPVAPPSSSAPPPRAPTKVPRAAPRVAPTVSANRGIYKL